MKEFKHFGVMIDCSRNAVMNVATIKRFIDCLQIMGYNTLELYTEDTYEIHGEPRFGYLRGKYTAIEIKDIDRYASERGIELIPCVQTLGHFTALIKNIEFDEIVDSNDVLFVDEEKTYKFIEKIFATLAKNFTSRRVNIGMDETFALGRGKFLDKYGFEDRFSIFIRHLQKTVEIAKKYGFTPHIWSDMFFRIATGRYSLKEKITFPEKVLSALPENVELAYWDYDHYEKSEYDIMFECHEQFNKNIWFAGGAWSWTGFAPSNAMAIKKCKAAMQSVRKNGILDVLITMWGDDGAECSCFSLLPTLYATRRYADGETDDGKIREEFYRLFGVAFDDFLLLDLPDLEYAKDLGASKSFFYNDLFLGVYDKNVPDGCSEWYKERAKELKGACKRAKEYAYIFESQAKLCEVLSIKAELGVKIRKAYRAKDKKALKTCLRELKETQKYAIKFHEKFCELWLLENKPHGWEIQDARIGGLIRRINTCMARLQKYLSGQIEKIEELEEEILDYKDSKRYGYIVSRNLT